MLVGILSRLAGFSLRRPKLLLLIVAGVGVAGFAVHYKLLVGERDKLRVAEAGYERAVVAFEAREQALRNALINEQVAAAEAATERDAARRALEEFRAGREGDPEALKWAAERVPEGETARLCAALPDMEGC